MASKLPLLVLLFLLSPATSGSADGAFSVTGILAPFPEFRILNFLLAKTGLAADIDRRQVVTVLAPDNAAVSAVMHRAAIPMPALKKLLAVHVVLDYFDAAKLGGMARNRTTVVTTLFQTTGVAMGGAGFVNLTVTADGRAVFGSAAPGAPGDATVRRAVAARPYSISVLQVSNVIVPPGIVRGLPLPAPPKRQIAPPPIMPPAAAPQTGRHPARPSSMPPSPATSPSAVAPAPSHGLSGQVIPLPSAPGTEAAKGPSSLAGRRLAGGWGGVRVAAGVACMVLVCL